MYSEVLDLNQLTMLSADGPERPVNTVEIAIDTIGEGNVMKEVVSGLEDARASQNKVDNVHAVEGHSETECGDIEKVTKDIETEKNQLDRLQICSRCLKERQSAKDHRLYSVATTSVTNLSCDCCSKSFGRSDEKVQPSTKHRTRLKSRRLHTDPRDNRLRWSDSTSLKPWRAVLAKKTTMLRVLCHCVVLIVVFACGGVLMMSHKHHNRYIGGDILSKHPLPSGLTFEDYNEDQHSGDDHIIRDLPFRKVSREEFEKHILTAKSTASLLKIFFDDPNLTDEQVDIILQMKAHPGLRSADGPRLADDAYVNDDGYQNDRTYNEAAMQNLVENSKNPSRSCSQPRPEIAPVESVEAGVIRQFYPDCIVVHRCRNTSGCCRKGYECGPKTIDSFTKYFFVFETNLDATYLQPRRNFVEPRTFLNHTSCECKKIEISTNCHKACPSQFQHDRSGVNCTCVCHPQNHKCKRIQRGFYHLDEADLMCIKAEECIKPTCIADEFNVRTGYCPHIGGKHHHRRRH